MKSRADLLTLPDVVAVADGIESGAPCIRVYLAKENAETRLQLPPTLEHLPLVVEVGGELKPGL